MMFHLEEDRQQIKIAIDQLTWEIDRNRGWFESYYQHEDSAVDKFNNGNGTTIGAVEGSSYRGEMKDETNYWDSKYCAKNNIIGIWQDPK